MDLKTCAYRATDETGLLATLRGGPLADEEGLRNGRIGRGCSAGGIPAERGDADGGGGYGDAAAEGAGVGCPTDRGGIGLQPHDGSPIFGAGRVGGVSRTGSAADADWARGMGGGTGPPACRQRRCSSTGARARE